ncbi:MAG: dicarboxylate--CoA ligase PimA [Pseudolabrys sp.]|nr:dicarboxylate--CoA ligase PimA [Pseudolabrys sp.]
MTARPYIWEKSYPPGILWDTPIVTTTVPALIDSAAARFADRSAIEFRDRQLLYRDLADASQRLAAGLLRLGAGRDTSVGIFLPNTPDHTISFFAITRIGARAVQLSPLDAEREIVHKIKDSGARVVLTINLPGLLPMAQKLRAAGHIDLLIVADDERWGPGPVPPLPIVEGDGCVSLATLMKAELPARWPDISKDDIALLQYTGGTTGVPKGAMLTHANLTASCAMYDAWFNPQSSVKPGKVRVICALPLFHIFALSTVMLRNLSNGNEVMLRAKFDVETTFHDIEVKRATHMNGVPTMWIALCNAGVETRDLSSLVSCSSGGAPLPVEVEQRFEALTGKRLRSGIGMTETSPAACTQPVVLRGKPGSCGLPLPGVYVDVVSLDDPQRVLGFGETGEIRISGANVAGGYWNRAAESAETFVDGRFMSGDIGYMDDDGYVWVVDRKKDLVISGGFNVYPRVVEEAIYEHPGVHEAIVIGVPDSYRGETIKAYVTTKPGAAPLSLETLRAFLADKIGRQEMPTALEIRDTLPRTTVGKLSKKELVEEEKKKFKSSAAPAAELSTGKPPLNVRS